jgi:hypothetical protein
MNQLVIMKKLRWYHRLWHKILTWRGKECYALEVVPTHHRSYSSPYIVQLERTFLCPGCWEYKSWDCGCAHEDPQESRLCDDCWVALKEAGAVHE